MRLSLLVSLLCFPFFCFAQHHVEPDGWALYLFAAIFFAILFAGFLLFGKRVGSHSKFNNPLTRSRVSVRLIGNHQTGCTLQIVNQTPKAIQIDEPVLVFYKWTKKRKFRIKGTKEQVTFPLSLVTGQSFEIRISWAVFYQHDSALRYFHRARVNVPDAQGRNYSTNFIRLS